MKAILLHHAGGDKYAYREMQRWLLPEVESISIELAGRGDRYSESLLYSIDEMVEDIYRQVKNEINEDYILTGMSMGAVLAFLLVHKLKAEQLPLPRHLFLAARLPFQHYETKTGIMDLPSSTFWQFVLEYDERSRHVADHQELRELFEPIMRADFIAMQYFDNKFKGLPKLDVPSSILFGEEDIRMFDREKATAWNEYFTKTPTYHPFPGGHFFIYEKPEAAEYIKSVVK
jgi:surfactin synthase thioesterase subunit